MNLEKMVDERVKPEYYFDLVNFKHKALFDNVEFVWEPLKKLPDYIRENIKPQNLGKVDPRAIIGENVSIGKDTIVEPYAIIKGPAIIGEGCWIQSFAYIRENVILGNYIRIGQSSELKHCVIIGGEGPEKKEKANAGHYNYIGYSIIGTKVLFGARATTSSLKADWEKVRVKINEREYNTGLPQLGAIIGDNAIIGSHVCLNPGSLIGKRSWIYEVPFWRGFLPSDKIAKSKKENREQSNEIIDKR